MKVSPMAIYGGAAIVGLLIVYKFAGLLGKGAAAAADTAAGIVTGNNAVTESATNAAGEKTTAYQGAGVAGTIGAATNAASGGVLASVGESIGGWWASVTGADQNDKIAAMLKGGGAQSQTASQSNYAAPTLTSATDTGHAPNLTMYSVLNGATFKDMSSADAVNTFSTADAYGGGLSLR